MLPSDSVEILEYLDPNGRSPFAVWFADLNGQAAAKVVVGLTRLAQGNCSNVKGVGSGVYEYRVNFGPGYRIYFAEDGGASRHPAGRGSEEASAEGHQRRHRQMAGLQEEKEEVEVEPWH